MTLFVVAVLLVTGVLAAVIGAIASSAAAFALAALCGGAAVVLLWRFSATRRDRIFLSRPPVQSAPDWDKPLRSTEVPPTESLKYTSEVVAIDRYDDLLAAEILPSLETLSIEELEAVIRKEKAGLARVAVMNRAQVLIDLTKGGALDVQTQSLASTPVDEIRLDEPAEQSMAPAAKSQPQRAARPPVTRSSSSKAPAARPTTARRSAAEKAPPSARGTQKPRPALSQTPRPDAEPTPTNEKRRRKGPDLSI